MTAETRSFQAEVSKLLNIVANSLYSEREVFLRELISNAADACDKLRFLALSNPELTGGDGDFKVTISADKDAGTLTLSDNGVGMSEEELHQNLGTIARSGTAAFVEEMADDAKKDSGLIGQFGVGFYSAFMVADKVEVLTRKAGTDDAALWSSDGLGEYTVSASEKAAHGTMITLHLKEDAKEFLEKARLSQIVRTYSDHIPFPVVFSEGEETETLNKASALWARSKSEISEDDYKEFYRHVGHAFDEPAQTIHWKAEGRIEYNALLFVPSQRPFDLFHPERRHHLKLYVRRVFITDEVEGLVPTWLRFIKGVIDCEDLPLNVSRELLQRNPAVTSISQAVTKRILSELQKLADKKPEDYASFWKNFGAVMKEGLYSDGMEHRDALLKLARFRTSKSAGGDEGWISLADYIERMKEGQEAIFYISAENEQMAKASPQLEGFEKKGVEVLMLTDPIDEFWIQAMFDGFEGKPFKSITRGGADLSSIKSDESEKSEEGKKDEADEAKADDGEISALIASLKLALGEAVKDVRSTDRLADSPVCLIAEEGDMDMNLERMLRQHKQLDETAKRVLEVNPDHALIKGLAKTVSGGKAGADLSDAAFLLLDQARILEGEPIPDGKAFTRRFADVMVKALG